MMLVRENKLESVAFPVLNSERRGFPPTDGAHIALRTVRRFLEKYPEGINHVIFCLHTPQEYALYMELLPLYFPRSHAEAVHNKSLLPSEVGNENGEIVIEERKIRITESIFQKSSGTTQSNPFSTTNMTTTSSSAVADFTTMKREDPLAGSVSTVSDPDRQRMATYVGHLRRAKQNYSDFEEKRFLYSAGTDTFGRQIVVLVAKYLPFSTVSADKLMLYLFHTLDAVVEREYVVVYLHTLSESENQPDFSWMKTVYETMPRKYKRNMKAMYVIHPTFWFKAFWWFISPFLSDRAYDKIVYLESVHELFSRIDRSQIRIPDFVFQHDREINGENAAAIVQATSSSSNAPGEL
eukprot:TRINITY_DN5675_c0_g1_i2.p1 TRINITY_DN5675_c0_g1~~TRINITY_DN5675_c0_g1_i2.p1  ORF type:complete len:352 (+),score=79.26 TRINITY_DN5675_c0_g1_i2:477-1532(+)